VGGGVKDGRGGRKHSTPNAKKFKELRRGNRTPFGFAPSGSKKASYEGTKNPVNAKAVGSRKKPELMKERIRAPTRRDQNEVHTRQQHLRVVWANTLTKKQGENLGKGNWGLAPSGTKWF